MKIKKGDQVKVIRGKDSGKTGSVEKVYAGESKVLVTGVNQYKRHVKSRAQNRPSEITTLTKPLPVSNVLLLCPKCKLTTRAGYNVQKNKKVRICRRCEQEI